MRHEKTGKGAPRRARHTNPGEAALIYGWHSALAALRNPERRIRRLMAAAPALSRLVELGVADAGDQPADPREIDRIAGPGAVHQGIAVLCDPLPEHDLSDLGDAALLVVLDQVTDPHNVGAILRSAAAFGADALVMTERHGPADSAVLAKAASGGLEHVAIVRVKNLARALDHLGQQGVRRVGLDSENAGLIEDAVGAPRQAIVLGAEGKGLRRLTREKCDVLVRIDMPGAIKSLNVSNAAALALYALTRRTPR